MIPRSYKDVVVTSSEALAKRRISQRNHTTLCEVTHRWGAKIGWWSRLMLFLDRSMATTHRWGAKIGWWSPGGAVLEDVVTTSLTAGVRRSAGGHTDVLGIPRDNGDLTAGVRRSAGGHCGSRLATAQGTILTAGVRRSAGGHSFQKPVLADRKPLTAGVRRSAGGHPSLPEARVAARDLTAGVRRSAGGHPDVHSGKIRNVDSPLGCEDRLVVTLLREAMSDASAQAHRWGAKIGWWSQSSSRTGREPVRLTAGVRRSAGGHPATPPPPRPIPPSPLGCEDRLVVTVPVHQQMEQPGHSPLGCEDRLVVTSRSRQEA